MVEVELARVARRGRTELLFGVVFLAACFALSSAAASSLEPYWLSDFISEGLIIVGWIALWHPVDMLLFERWPLRRDIRLLRTIRDAEIRIGSTDA